MDLGGIVFVVFVGRSLLSCRLAHADALCMKLYLAVWPSSIGDAGMFVGGESQLTAMARKGEFLDDITPRILCSYHYFGGDKLKSDIERYFKPITPEIFADSGAYSIFSRGATITVEEYADWLEANLDVLEVYANLDIHGNLDLTLDNQTYLESRGLTPLPVYHAEQDISVLETYCKHYPYVCVGGVAGMKAGIGPLMGFLVKVFRVAEKYGTALHGFGMTGWKILSALPWYSVDSSSWSASFRFGNAHVFHPDRGKFYQLKLGDAKSCYRFADLLEGYGFDPEDFADRERNDRVKIATLACLSWWKAEQYLRKRHGTIEPPDMGKGLKMYLSGANRTDDFRRLKEML